MFLKNVLRIMTWWTRGSQVFWEEEEEEEGRGSHRAVLATLDRKSVV